MRLGIITDVHISPAGSPPAAWHNPYDLEGAPRRLELALTRLRAEGVDAVAVLGDLTNTADASCVERGLNLLAGAGIPVRVVPGNHDAEPGGVDLAACLLALDQPAVRGADPAGEMVQGIRLAGVGLAPATNGYDNWAMGPLSATTWGAEPVVLLSHAPVIDRDAVIAAAGLNIAGNFADPSGVRALLSARPGPTIVLNGHYHIRDASISGRILQIGCAALVEPPHEVGVLDLTPESDGLLVRVQRLGIAPVTVARLPVLVEERQAWRYTGGEWRVVPFV